MPLLPITVLSGFLGAGKTTLLKYILSQPHGYKIALIVNDMSDINIDAALIKGGSTLKYTEEKLIEMSNGCICCTLREDLLIELRQLAAEHRFDYVLIESTGIADPLHIAETFSFVDEQGQSLQEIAYLDTLVTVVDAARFVSDFFSTQSLQEMEMAAGEEDTRHLVDLLISQIECANVILINKIDQVDTAQLAEIQAMITRLNPSAKQITATRGQVDLADIFHTQRFNMTDMEHSPKWLQVMRGEEHSESDEYGIHHFAYHARRPFHPQRFFDWMNNNTWQGLLRSKGYFWLASRPTEAFEWAQAGQLCEYGMAGQWWAAIPKEHWPQDAESLNEIQRYWHPEVGDARQQLVFIGINLDQSAIIESLNACLFTDDEMNIPIAQWSDLEDPFIATTELEAVSDPA